MVSSALTDSQHPVWSPFLGSWILAIIAESCVLLLKLPHGIAFWKHPRSIDWMDHHSASVRYSIRVAVLLSMILLVWLSPSYQKKRIPKSEESEPLLQANKPKTKATKKKPYTKENPDDSSDSEAEEEDPSTITTKQRWMFTQEQNSRLIKLKVRRAGGWWNYVTRFRVSIFQFV